MPLTTAERPQLRFCLRIGGGAQAPSRARTELSRLRDELEPPVLEGSRLLVTELVTNAVRHAGVAAIELSVAVGPDLVRIEVSNPGTPFRPRLNEPGAEQESGWGLFLVDRLSDEWGVIDDADRQRVWFELRR